MKKSPLANERGVYMILTAISASVLLGITFLIFNLGELYILKAQLQNASDLAAISGMRAYAKDQTITTLSKPVTVSALVLEKTFPVHHGRVDPAIGLVITEFQLGHYSKNPTPSVSSILPTGTNNPQIDGVHIHETVTLKDGKVLSADSIAVYCPGNHDMIMIEGNCPCGNHAYEPNLGEHCDFMSGLENGVECPASTPAYQQDCPNLKTCDWCTTGCLVQTKTSPPGPCCGDSTVNGPEVCDGGTGCDQTTCMCPRGQIPDGNKGCKPITPPPCPTCVCADLSGVRSNTETTCTPGTNLPPGAVTVYELQNLVNDCPATTPAGKCFSVCKQYFHYDNGQCVPDCDINKVCADPAGTEIQVGIKTWSACNVGATTSSESGCYFTYDESRSACKDGWHLPAENELPMYPLKGDFPAIDDDSDAKVRQKLNLPYAGRMHESPSVLDAYFGNFGFYHLDKAPYGDPNLGGGPYVDYLICAVAHGISKVDPQATVDNDFAACLINRLEKSILDDDEMKFPVRCVKGGSPPPPLEAQCSGVVDSDPTKILWTAAASNGTGPYKFSWNAEATPSTNPGQATTARNMASSAQSASGAVTDAQGTLVSFSCAADVGFPACCLIANCNEPVVTDSQGLIELQRDPNLDAN